LKIKSTLPKYVVITYNWLVGVNMKKIYIITLLVLLLFGITSAYAQEEITIDQVYVELRPEYDSPDILIVYSVLLSEDLNYPVDITVNIPASSGGPSDVWEVIDGLPVATTFDLTQEGDWISVNIKTESPLIYVDFYDPDFNNQSSTRSYTYRYPDGLISDVVNLVLWQPAETENFQTSISFPEISEDEFGTIFHMASINPDALDNYEIDFSYIAAPNAAADLDSDFSLTDALPWAMGILGLGILAMGIYNLSSKSGSKVKSSKKKYANKGRGSNNKKNKFCHKCGAKIYSKDKFCSECGAKTR